MNVKKENAYKSIGEVAKLLNLVSQKTGKLNTHTIRFWEKKFIQVKPKILSGNRRYFDPSSIEVLKKIKYLNNSEYVLRPDFINTFRMMN